MEHDRALREARQARAEERKRVTSHTEWPDATTHEEYAKRLSGEDDEMASNEESGGSEDEEEKDNSTCLKWSNIWCRIKVCTTDDHSPTAGSRAQEVNHRCCSVILLTMSSSSY